VVSIIWHFAVAHPSTESATVVTFGNRAINSLPIICAITSHRIVKSAAIGTINWKWRRIDKPKYLNDAISETDQLKGKWEGRTFEISGSLLWPWWSKYRTCVTKFSYSGIKGQYGRKTCWSQKIGYFLSIFYRIIPFQICHRKAQIIFEAYYDTTLRTLKHDVF
jgi:hypothetical protein